MFSRSFSFSRSLVLLFSFVCLRYGAIHAKEQANIIETALSDKVTTYAHGRATR